MHTDQFWIWTNYSFCDKMFPKGVIFANFHEEMLKKGIFCNTSLLMHLGKKSNQCFAKMY